MSSSESGIVVPSGLYAPVQETFGIKSPTPMCGEPVGYVHGGGGSLMLILAERPRWLTSIVAIPAATRVTCPALTVTAALFDELQEATPVTSVRVPSLHSISAVASAE